jgi:dinuclear metal center YbgI/SA1388 family protein
MAALAEIVEYLDEALRIGEIADYPGALNGLQLENHGTVRKIVAAVDASLPVIEKACQAGRDALLLVHHGMFWQGAQPVRGAFYRKLKSAMDHGLAVYSAHLPLDVHPRWGNNILLAQALGMENPQPFLDWKGLPVGLKGGWRGTRAELAARLEQAVAGPVHICPGGGGELATIGICTGGAGGEVARAAAAGIDAFVTGEGPHWSYPLAEELGVDLFYAGHYATETFGVRALAADLAGRFSLPWEFIDHPTGL